jgi:hypothetical protein
MLKVKEQFERCSSHGTQRRNTAFPTPVPFRRPANAAVASIANTTSAANDSVTVDIDTSSPDTLKFFIIIETFAGRELIGIKFGWVIPNNSVSCTR